jgi:chromate reductase
MTQPRILAFSGSLRKDSYNTKLVNIAAQGAQEAGAQVTCIELRDYPLPLFDEDYEAEHGMPENLLKLKKLFEEHDGLLIASPEYNSSYSGALKNAIDWLTRKATDDEPMLAAFKNKTCSIMACSPGALGGLRGLSPLRVLLSNIGVIVLPTMQAVGKIGQEIDDNGNCTTPKTEKKLKAMGAQTVKFVKASQA